MSCGSNTIAYGAKKSDVCPPIGSRVSAALLYARAGVGSRELGGF